MKLEKSDKLNSDIQYLSNKLIGGFNDCRRFKDKSHNKDLINGKLDKFIAEIQSELQKWINEVMDYIQSDLKMNYYQYHFMAHKSGSSVYIGINEKISNLIISWESYLKNLEDIIFRLEDARNLQVRREIAEIENQADILYEVKYSEHSREIKLNNIILAKPDFESENEQFFTYVYSNPNEPIKVSDIESYYKIKLKKSISDIVRDLGFKSKTRQVFFPVADKNKVMFTNPISKKYFVENDLPVISMVNLRGTARDSEPEIGKDS